jgi:hypothetical protein
MHLPSRLDVTSMTTKNLLTSKDALTIKSCHSQKRLFVVNWIKVFKWKSCIGTLMSVRIIDYINL